MTQCWFDQGIDKFTAYLLLAYFSLFEFMQTKGSSIMCSVVHVLRDSINSYLYALSCLPPFGEDILFFPWLSVCLSVRPHFIARPSSHKLLAFFDKTLQKWSLLNLVLPILSTFHSAYFFCRVTTLFLFLTNCLAVFDETYEK